LYNRTHGASPPGSQPQHQQLHQQRHQRPQESQQRPPRSQQALRRGTPRPTQANNSIINKLLLSSDRDSLEITKDILGHLLHIVDLKGINIFILSILTKVIAFIKTIEEE
jgi:hypothetical protein